MDESKLINLLLEHKSIAIFGTGSGAVKVVSRILPLLDKVKFFIDNNKEKERFCDKKVYTPLEVNYFELDLIIVASSFTDEIEAQLQELNKNENLQYYFPFKKWEAKVKVGKYTYGLSPSAATFPSQIEEIGSFCSINPTASIGAVNHPLEYVSTHPFCTVRTGGLLIRIILNIKEIKRWLLATTYGSVLML